MSPVCMMKAGGVGIALILAIASWNVPSAFGLAGLLKATWLSLIWRQVKPLVAGSAGEAPPTDTKTHTNQPKRTPHPPTKPPQHAPPTPAHPTKQPPPVQLPPPQ